MVLSSCLSEIPNDSNILFEYLTVKKIFLWNLDVTIFANSKLAKFITLDKYYIFA